jgi:hypothetical protein
MAISSLASRDQPSAVLKATMRTGDEYWPSKKLADQRGPVGMEHVGLGPGQAAERAAEVIEHEIDIPTEGVWYNRR